jgi:hypothetical protein
VTAIDTSTDTAIVIDTANDSETTTANSTLTET